VSTRGFAGTGNGTGNSFSIYYYGIDINPPLERGRTNISPHHTQQKIEYVHNIITHNIQTSSKRNQTSGATLIDMPHITYHCCLLSAVHAHFNVERNEYHDDTLVLHRNASNKNY
jgi:hypothetical protein